MVFKIRQIHSNYYSQRCKISSTISGEIKVQKKDIQQTNKQTNKHDKETNKTNKNTNKTNKQNKQTGQIKGQINRVSKKMSQPYLVMSMIIYAHLHCLSLIHI